MPRTRFDIWIETTAMNSQERISHKNDKFVTQSELDALKETILLFLEKRSEVYADTCIKHHKGKNHDCSCGDIQIELSRIRNKIDLVFSGLTGVNLLDDARAKNLIIAQGVEGSIPSKPINLCKHGVSYHICQKCGR